MLVPMVTEILRVLSVIFVLVLISSRFLATIKHVLQIVLKGSIGALVEMTDVYLGSGSKLKLLSIKEIIDINILLKLEL